MSERKIFRPEEVEYIWQAIQAYGCADSENPDRTKCPFWNWNVRDDETGELGNCICKNTEQLCRIIELISLEPNLVLVVREKTQADYMREEEEQRQEILKQLVELKRDREKLNLSISQLESQMRQLGKGEEYDT